MKGTSNFYEENFKPKDWAANIFEKSGNVEVIKTYITSFEGIINKVNEQQVTNLEEKSSSFVDLSKCISLFEHEFLDFPQKISEIQKLVNEASNFPEPNFAEVPPIPHLPNEDIIGIDADIIDAPLIYDSYVQQHRISESVEFFIVTSQNIKERDIKIPYLLEWAAKTKNILLKEIQNRLKVLPIESDKAQASFIQLVKLGFSDEGVDFYIKLATQAIEERFNTIQNSGLLLQYVKDTSNALASELDQKGRIFLSLFRNKEYAPILVEWMDRMVDTKLLIHHPEAFAGNFNLVKESISIMRTAMAPLEHLGLSCFYVFDAYPKYFQALLKSVHSQHLIEIDEALKDDEYDINMEGIRTAKPEDFPLSTSFDHFRVNLVKFLTELRDIYVPDLFYTGTVLLKELILAYPIGCKNLLQKELSSIDKFCSILIQLVCVQDLLIPVTLNDFRDITGREFPDSEEIAEKCSEAMSFIDNMLVSTFISMWANLIMPDQQSWSTMDKINRHFKGAVRSMSQFLQMLNLPQSLFDQTSELLVEAIVSVSENTLPSNEVIKAATLNSFQLHWTFFILSVEDLLSDEVNNKLRDGFNQLFNAIAEEQGIEEDQRVSSKKISALATEFLEKENDESDEFEDSEDSDSNTPASEDEDS